MSIRQGIPPVCLAAVLLAAPAAHGAQIAYVQARPTEEAVITVTNANTFNLTEPVTQTALTFDGLTSIEFGDRWPNLRDHLNVQLSATRNQGDCGIAGWWSNEIEVQCHRGDGGRDFRDFLLLAIKPAPAETDRIAFAVLDRSTEASYIVEEQRRFGTGTMRATRTGVGQYSINLTTLLGVASTENTVQVTALDRTAQCKVASWFQGTVHVGCYDMHGTPMDSQVSVLALKNSMPGLSFVWNSTPGGSVSAAYSHASDGSAQTVTRSGVGQYAVTLGPEAVTGGHVQVTAYGSGSAAYCWVAAWADRVAQIRCARDGVLTDSLFTVMALRSQGVIPAQALGGTTPTGALICPTALFAGDRDFGGHGPAMWVSSSVGPSADGSRLVLSVDFTAQETEPDSSLTAGTFTRTLFVAPAGRTVGAVLTSASFLDYSVSAAAGCCGDERMVTRVYGDGYLIRQATMVGDTDGDDISADADCGNDTRLQRILLNEIRFVLN